jgi:transcription antitermination factor NusG
MTALAQLEKGQFIEFVERPAIVDKPIAQCHYMLRLHPNYEMKAERQLHERNIDAYVPKEGRSVRTVWGRRRLRMVPIFAGIMFIPDYQADLSRLKAIADGIGGFIKRTNKDGMVEAVEVSSLWMNRIRRFELDMTSEERVKARKFQVNQKVRIVGGPFDMWEGQIERLDSHHRLRVLLNILEREVPVEFDEDQVEAV